MTATRLQTANNIISHHLNLLQEKNQVCNQACIDASQGNSEQLIDLIQEMTLSQTIPLENPLLDLIHKVQPIFSNSFHEVPQENESIFDALILGLYHSSQRTISQADHVKTRTVIEHYTQSQLSKIMGNIESIILKSAQNGDLQNLTIGLQNLVKIAPLDPNQDSVRHKIAQLVLSLHNLNNQLSHNYQELCKLDQEIVHYLKIATQTLPELNALKSDADLAFQTLKLSFKSSSIFLKQEELANSEEGKRCEQLEESIQQCNAFLKNSPLYAIYTQNLLTASFSNTELKEILSSSLVKNIQNLEKTIYSNYQELLAYLNISTQDSNIKFFHESLSPELAKLSFSLHIPDEHQSLCKTVEQTSLVATRVMELYQELDRLNTESTSLHQKFTVLSNPSQEPCESSSSLDALVKQFESLNESTETLENQMKYIIPEAIENKQRELSDTQANFKCLLKEIMEKTRCLMHNSLNSAENFTGTIYVLQSIAALNELSSKTQLVTLSDSVKNLLNKIATISTLYPETALTRHQISLIEDTKNAFIKHHIKSDINSSKSNSQNVYQNLKSVTDTLKEDKSNLEAYNKCLDAFTIETDFLTSELQELKDSNSADSFTTQNLRSWVHAIKCMDKIVSQLRDKIATQVSLLSREDLEIFSKEQWKLLNIDSIFTDNLGQLHYLAQTAPSTKLSEEEQLLQNAKSIKLPENTQYASNV